MVTLPDALSILSDSGTLALFMSILPDNDFRFTLTKEPDKSIDPEEHSTFSTEPGAELSSSALPDKLFIFTLS